MFHFNFFNVAVALFAAAPPSHPMHAEQPFSPPYASHSNHNPSAQAFINHEAPNAECSAIFACPPSPQNINSLNQIAAQPSNERVPYSPNHNA